MTCMSAIVCFNISARTAISPTQEIGKPAKIIHFYGSIRVKFPLPDVWHFPKVIKTIFHSLVKQSFTHCTTYQINQNRQ